MNTNQKKIQVKNIILFLLLAFLALALIVTCASAFAYAFENQSAFRGICGVFAFIAGGYGIYKASRKVMEPFTKDEENL